MLLKALDLLRTLAWALIQFIFGLIDTLFEILKGLNSYDIINSVSGDKNFVIFQRGVIVIAVTLLGLFAITRFTKKIIDPDDSLSTEAIVKEIVKGFSNLTRDEKIKYIQDNIPMGADLMQVANDYRHETNQMRF